MQSTSIHMVIKSDTLNIEHIGISINDLCSLYTTEMISYHIDLCVTEVLNNIVEHSYEYKTNKDIDIYFFIDRHSCAIEISDYGRCIHIEQQQYINNATLVDIDTEDHDDHEISERGRGLLIIKHVMDHVSYRTHLGKNTFSMKKMF